VKLAGQVGEPLTAFVGFTHLPPSSRQTLPTAFTSKQQQIDWQVKYLTYSSLRQIIQNVFPQQEAAGC
jgi:hypothetical protein